MKTLKFMGYSDDTFGEYGVTNEDHDDCGNGTSMTFEVKAEGKTMYVTGKYSPNGSGCWLVGAEPADEDNLPDWTMRMYFKGYTAVLEVDVPDDVTVQYVKKDKK